MGCSDQRWSSLETAEWPGAGALSSLVQPRRLRAARLAFRRQPSPARPSVCSLPQDILSAQLLSLTKLSISICEFETVLSRPDSQQRRHNFRQNSTPPRCWSMIPCQTFYSAAPSPLPRCQSSCKRSPVLIQQSAVGMEPRFATSAKLYEHICWSACWVGNTLAGVSCGPAYPGDDRRSSEPPSIPPVKKRLRRCRRPNY